jgi:hypothetical protein
MRTQLEVQFLSVSTGRPQVRQPGLRLSLLLPDERGGPHNTLALVQRMHDRAAHHRCRTHRDQPGLADLWERVLGKDNAAPEDRRQRNRGSSTRTRERAVRAAYTLREEPPPAAREMRGQPELRQERLSQRGRRLPLKESLRNEGRQVRLGNQQVGLRKRAAAEAELQVARSQVQGRQFQGLLKIRRKVPAQPAALAPFQSGQACRRALRRL